VAPLNTDCADPIHAAAPSFSCLKMSAARMPMLMVFQPMMVTRLTVKPREAVR
jgi:hypothetical protein